MEDKAALAPGQIALALDRIGQWFPVEIVRVNEDSSYHVRWLDGGGRAFRADHSNLRHLPPPFDEVPEHRFSLNDRIIVGFAYGSWFGARIVGLFEAGYHVEWEGGVGPGSILELSAEKFPEASFYRVGDQVLVKGKDGWREAKIKAIFADRAEIIWAVGGAKDSVYIDFILPFVPSNDPASALEESGKNQPSGTEAPSPEIPSASPELQHFAAYLEKRLATQDVKPSADLDRLYCPHCKSTHDVTWIEDIAYNSMFYMCALKSAEPGVVVRPSKQQSLSALTVDQFLTQYPATAKRQVPFLSRLMRSSSVQVSPFPPFVTVTFGRNS